MTTIEHRHIPVSLPTACACALRTASTHFPPTPQKGTP